MAGSNFVDYVKIYCRSGKGGPGSMHFHREKYITKGGPDGGDGGQWLSRNAGKGQPDQGAGGVAR